MDKWAFSLMFLASGPIVLMPSAIALFTRNGHRIGIVGVNTLVWLGLYYLLHEVVVSGSGIGIAVPLPLAIAVWLILLKVAISAGKAKQFSEQEAVPENGASMNIRRVQATREARAPDA